jgi:hypothetical protein
MGEVPRLSDRLRGSRGGVDSGGRDIAETPQFPCLSIAVVTLIGNAASEGRKECLEFLLDRVGFWFNSGRNDNGTPTETSSQPPPRCHHHVQPDVHSCSFPMSSRSGVQ